ncbi:cobalamin biosynthesis protein CobQ [Falsiruegeria mediterranea]|uniref:Cobalamin biosynthesis protein CobQ n=1 Tax=Falsiruegeria mediterranea M17 TaxID=1200281 RepID=A0A2R8C557_9RHOB|nr:cobalamin biosynthesis protein CobQ [Falsiruegeria mediterranea]SPJ27584.1 hypothetical protein TRM7615_01074 [Falsiruegeria mediterranea M17]
MNTPAHLLIGAAAFGVPGHGRIMGAALLGAVMPDVSLYVLAGVSLFVLGIPEDVVFGELYFSSAWQTVFAIDNSFLIWGVIMALALRLGWRPMTAFASAGLLHLGTDFVLHSGDGRAHFWPLNDWVFHSPVSYWDSSHHAHWIVPIAVSACVLAYLHLWRGGISAWGRVGFGSLLAAELWVASQWLSHF